LSSTWIFQANPARFDIPAYLAARPVESEWLVSRYFNDIRPGDQVFIWRSGSDDKKQPAGVIADATALTPVREVVDDGPAHFWMNSSDRLAVRPRVRIALGRVANKKEVIKRDWWKEDPILSDHLIMRMPNHTTFRIEGEVLTRLEQLWERTGSDWTYEDAVAGLFAFAETRGGKVSKLPGSPVATISLIIGRAIPGVFNKVMNFRSLDGEDERAGLDGASDQDRTVWAQFYGPAGFRSEEVRAEFERLWVLPAQPVDARAAQRDYEEQTDQLTRELSLAELWDRYRAKGKATAQTKPQVRHGASKVYARDPVVGAIARKRANQSCEAPGCTVPLFLDVDGDRYLEVHHIHTLATGGPDTPENVACLCPLHHREAHHGADATKLTASLTSLRASETAP
jgi:hypothetical protein